MFFPKNLETDFVEALRLDSLESLITLMVNVKDVNMYLSNVFFSNDIILCNSPPLASVAAFLRAKECLIWLINMGANLKLKDYNDIPISHFAVAGGSIEIMKILDLNGVSFESSIFLAAEKGCLDTFMWIYYNYLVDLKVRRLDKTTLLHAAVKSRNRELIKFLLNEMADVLELNDVLEVTQELKNSQASDVEEESISD